MEGQVSSARSCQAGLSSNNFLFFRRRLGWREVCFLRLQAQPHWWGEGVS